jgi:hypothetical protein
MGEAGRGRLRLAFADLVEVEEVVEQLRFMVGLEEGEVPSTSDAWRLAAFTPQLEIELRNSRTAVSWIRADRQAIVCLPDTWDEATLERALLEECGHVLFTIRAFDALSDTRGAERLFRLWEQRDEAKVRAFMLCWLIPRGRLLEFMGREPELAELCRCTEQEVWDRLELWGG